MDQIQIGSAENPDPTRPDPNLKKIISRSSDPISAIFFCWIVARRPRYNKKKIAEIGLVDREIIAKNIFSTPDQSWLRRIIDQSIRNTRLDNRSIIVIEHQLQILLFLNVS